MSETPRIAFLKRFGTRVLPIVILLGWYGVVTWTSIRMKSPTYDEPLHALASFTAIHLHDERIDFDNPPLWKYWAAIPVSRNLIHVDQTDPQWLLLPDDIVREWQYSIHSLYQTSENHPGVLIARMRFMMLLISIALGAMVAWWAWRVGGISAAIVATFLLSFDPNFIAHGAIIKNDIAISLIILGGAFSLWRLGQRISIARVLIVSLLCGAGCAVKFSGVLLPVIALMLLTVRAVMDTEWKWRARSLSRRSSRVLAAGLIGLCIFIGTIAVIWASYGFRFSVSPDPRVSINTQRVVSTLIQNEPNGDVPISTRAVLFALHHRLLPEAWLNGLMVIQASTLKRPTFLMGDYGDHTGLRYYPLAMLFKTPVATLVTMLFLIGYAFVARPSVFSKHRQWSAICLAGPPAIYFFAAILAPAAVALRHIFPIYPFLFVGAGWALAKAARGLSGKIVLIVLLVGLVVESVASFPNYLPFFNAAVGGSRAGVFLLSDSNLDWGQDLPLLARWQQAHPRTKLYLSYFGTADPAYYGIRYTNLPGGFELGPPVELPTTPGVLAISATELQGVYSTPQSNTRDYYAPLRQRIPIEVLGGSIFLFEFSGEAK